MGNVKVCGDKNNINQNLERIISRNEEIKKGRHLQKSKTNINDFFDESLDNHLEYNNEKKEVSSLKHMDENTIQDSLVQDFLINSENISINSNESFLSIFKQLDKLCFKHMLENSFNDYLNMSINKETIEELKIRNYNPYDKRKKRKNFFRKNLILCINKQKEIINRFLRSFNPCITEDIFDFNMNDKMINIFGFTQKKYFYREEESRPEIFILKFNDSIINKGIYIGVHIKHNGKLFAGIFNKSGKLNGYGIYVDKKGNLLFGDFKNSTCQSGTIHSLTDVVYEGTLKNLKKFGSNQIEYCQDYEFIGNFNNGKKISGIYYPKNNDIIKSIEIDRENFKILKKELNSIDAMFRLKSKLDINYKAVYLIKDGERQHSYEGKVQNNKFNEVCAEIHYNLQKYPYFIGTIQDNAKNGIGKYFWSLDEIYNGNFKNNVMQNDKKNDSKVILQGNQFNVKIKKNKVYDYDLIYKI